LSIGDDPSAERQPVKTIVLCTGSTTFSVYNSDLPAVVLKYEYLRRLGKAKNFNHEKAWQRIFKRILKRLEKIEEGPSAREFMNFFEFLNRLCTHTGNLSPSWPNLYNAFHSCGSEALSQIVYEEAFWYPARCPSDDSLPLELGQLTIQPDEDGISGKIDGQRVVLVSQQPLKLVYIRREETEYKDIPQLPPINLDEIKPIDPDKIKFNDSTAIKFSDKIKQFLEDNDKIKQFLKDIPDEIIKQFLEDPDKIKQFLEDNADEIKQFLKNALRDSYFKNELDRSSEEPIPESFQKWLTDFIQELGQAYGDLHYDPNSKILPWATDKSITQINKMSLRARILASVNLESLSSIEANGVYRGVPDIPRIIRARTRGYNRIYVKEIHRSRLSSKNLFEGFDPVVWVFHPHDENKEVTWDSFLPIGDIWYSPHIMYGEKMPGDTMDTGCFHLGAFAAFTPDYQLDEQARLLMWMKSGNQKHVPKIIPDIETNFSAIWGQDAPIYAHLMPEERTTLFKKHEILFLAAIHYARKYVIWISDKTRWPNSLLRRICKRQRKFLVCLTLDDFPSDDIENLRNYEYRVPSEFIDWAVDKFYRGLQSTDFVTALCSALSDFK
jgi:hypothetical protein